MSSSNPRILVAKKRDNSEVTIYLDGVHYRKTTNVLDIYRAAQDYRHKGDKTSLDKLRDLLSPKAHLIKKLFGGQFIKENDGKVYLEGTKTPLPPSLVSKMEEYEENDWNLQSFVNFWVLCLFNDNPEARDHFFDYCDKYGVTITDNGYAVLYKAVTQKKKVVENQDLIRVISESYIKVKDQKKGPSRFIIYRNTVDGTYRCSEYGQQDDEEIVGNLQELYDDIDSIKEETTIYTDKHSRKMEIRMGVPVKMDRKLCDDNSSIACSRGLHIGAYEYVRKFGLRGDTILATFVNPMNIVCIPKVDTSKIRCCEYVPKGVMEGGEQQEWKELSSGYWEDDYAGRELLQLKGELEDSLKTEKNVVQSRVIYLESALKDENKPVDSQESVQVYEEEIEEGVVETRPADE